MFKKFEKNILISIGIVSIGLGLLGGWVVIQNRLQEHQSGETQESTQRHISETAPTETETQSTAPARILVGGDVMLDRGVELRVKRDLGGEYNTAFELIQEDLNAADFVFINLEGPISDKGRDSGKQYSFRFEPETTEALSNAGIDLVSFANNHMFDWGGEALCDTTNRLTSEGIGYVGAGCDRELAERPFIHSLADTTIAWLAYTEFYQGAHAGDSYPGISYYDPETISQTIMDLKHHQNIDLVFVSMHWGEEYETRSNTYQQTTARQFIDSGADVIVGHHPHVAQEVEEYNNGFIIYSLGNFIFDQYFSEETMRGLVVELEVGNGELLGFTEHILQMNQYYQPRLLPQNDSIENLVIE